MGSRRVRPAPAFRLPQLFVVIFHADFHIGFKFLDFVFVDFEACAGVALVALEAVFRGFAGDLFGGEDFALVFTAEAADSIGGRQPRLLTTDSS